jgi:hypothetical protein
LNFDALAQISSYEVGDCDWTLVHINRPSDCQLSLWLAPASAAVCGKIDYDVLERVTT